MRGNKMSNERKWAAIISMHFWNLFAQSRKGNGTPARCQTYNSQGGKKEKSREKDAGVSHKHAPFPVRLFSPPHLLQEEEKMSLNLGCRISASQLSGSHWWGWTRAGAPVASGQREDFGVFMVEGVHLGKAVRWWDCTWWINASSVCSHFLRLTNRKTPQPNSSSSRSQRGKKEKWQHKKYVRESPFCGAAQNTTFWLASVQDFIFT